ncbi:type II toxin-antitoxin system RelE/ParE family toxin [Azospirillum endophyticum]
MEVIFAPAAIADLIAIRNYIRPFQSRSRPAHGAPSQKRCGSLADFPDRDRRRRDGAWEMVAVHPYVIVYDVTLPRVTRLRVWHEALTRP